MDELRVLIIAIKFRTKNLKEASMTMFLQVSSKFAYSMERSYVIAFDPRSNNQTYANL